MAPSDHRKLPRSPAESNTRVALIAAIVASIIAFCILALALYYVRARASSKRRQQEEDDAERQRLAQKIRETLSRREDLSSESLDDNLPHVRAPRCLF